MSFFDRLFGRTNKKPFESTPSSQGNKTIDDFSTLSADNRMILIMRMGDSNPVNISHAAFFQYAILSDPDINVKFAALKRIHFFKEHPDVIPMMIRLKDENSYDDMEPYFSMALNRLGIISIEDFQKKIQGS